MTYNQFYDVKALQESRGTNFNVDEEKNLIKWHDINVLIVEKEHPDTFFYKSFAEELIEKCVKKRAHRKRGTGVAINQTTFSIGLTQAYNEKIALSVAKKDIQDLIDKNVIPKSYYDLYYKNLLGGNKN